MLHQRFSGTVLVQCPAPARNPFSHEEKLRLKDFRGNEAKSWEFLCYDPLSAYVHKKTTISSTARGRGFVAQPVPNQTCVAAVALLILPPASWHFRNQYQKPIYGCVYHCLVLVHVNDVVLFLRQSLKQDEGQKPQRKKFQSQRQTSWPAQRWMTNSSSASDGTTSRPTWWPASSTWGTRSLSRMWPSPVTGRAPRPTRWSCPPAAPTSRWYFFSTCDIPMSKIMSVNLEYYIGWIVSLQSAY